MNPNDTIADRSAAEAPSPADAAPEESVSEPEVASDDQPAAEEPAAEGAAPDTVLTDTVLKDTESAVTRPSPTEPAVPQPRPAAEADGEAERGKAKKPRRAVRAAKSVGGTKTLVVWREGRLHYADDSVLVVDLDEAASPDTDVHDVVDRLAELREAAESTGRTETAAALVEIIQEKALS